MSVPVERVGFGVDRDAGSPSDRLRDSRHGRQPHSRAHFGHPRRLRDEPINLVLTIGSNADPADLGEQPAHVHIERYVSQSVLMPYCDLVVCHGGFGTVLTALDAGLPLVIIPIEADQPNIRSAATSTLVWR